MAGVEVIGLLCAGSVRYHHVRGGSSTPGQLSRADIAGLLSGLSAEQMALAQAKYMADEDAERGLIAHVRVWLASRAITRRWALVRGVPVLSNMAAIAVFESVRPNVCGVCSGVGLMGSRDCVRCSGAGHMPLPVKSVADAMGLCESVFNRTWMTRYADTLGYLQAMDGEIRRVVMRATREDEKSFA